jgi:hypothetical protein
MLDLSNTTLVIVVTRGHEISRLAVEACVQRASFGGVLIYTNDRSRIQTSFDGARYVDVPDWPNKTEAGRFYYSEAMKNVETSHALLIEWDGGIFDPSKWRADFFNYDYIGAPWIVHDNNKVGNGGFTLMSRRLGVFLYEHRAHMPCMTDFDVCRRWRQQLEREGGFRWPGVDVAADFAWELGPRSPNNFGYHGTFTWPRMLDRDDLITRARAMTSDPYIVTKMPPLIRAAPWLQQEIGSDAWGRCQAPQQTGPGVSVHLRRRRGIWQ